MFRWLYAAWWDWRYARLERAFNRPAPDGWVRHDNGLVTKGDPPETGWPWETKPGSRLKGAKK